MTSKGTTSARRAYRSPLRERQASQTRAAVIEAATSLFREKGWAATGMRDVARAAGVAVETVYASFRSKSELLAACIDQAVVADAQPVPLAQRPAFAALGQGTRQQRIRIAARLTADINKRGAAVFLALREAAASDEELAQLRRAAEAGRRRDVEQAVTLITGRTPTAQECDELWAVLGIEVYDLLTELRGWSTQQYEEWLAGVIDRLLPEHGRTASMSQHQNGAEQ